MAMLVIKPMVSHGFPHGFSGRSSRFGRTTLAARRTWTDAPSCCLQQQGPVRITYVHYITLHYTTLHYIHMHTYTYIYIHIHTYTSMYIHIHTHTCIYIHAHAYTYIFSYIYIYICMYTYVYMYICTFIYMYILRYIYIYSYLKQVPSSYILKLVRPVCLLSVHAYWVAAIRAIILSRG